MFGAATALAHALLLYDNKSKMFQMQRVIISLMGICTDIFGHLSLQVYVIELFTATRLSFKTNWYPTGAHIIIYQKYCC